jgi:DNA adenine methylase
MRFSNGISQALEREIGLSLHSRKQHHQAGVLYANPEMFDRVKRTWAVWMLANISYDCKLNGCFGYDRIAPPARRWITNARISMSITRSAYNRRKLSVAMS